MKTTYISAMSNKRFKSKGLGENLFFITNRSGYWASSSCLDVLKNLEKKHKVKFSDIKITHKKYGFKAWQCGVDKVFSAKSTNHKVKTMPQIILNKLTEDIQINQASELSTLEL